MRGAGWLALAVVLAGGCRKKAAEGPGESIDLGRESDPDANRPEVVGPVRWWDATGLCLEVPEGWSGFGKGAKGRLLSLEQSGTGVRFEVLLGDGVRDRADLIPVRKDAGSYRDIPALGPAGVESWTSDVPGGPTLHVWLAEVRGTPVRFEARYPFGHTFTGFTAVEGLLRAVCVE